MLVPRGKAFAFHAPQFVPLRRLRQVVVDGAAASVDAGDDCALGKMGDPLRSFADVDAHLGSSEMLNIQIVKH